MSADPILQTVAQTLQARPEVLLAWVYGSFASEKQTSQSDLDIAIAGSRLFTPEERVALAADLARVARREVDLVDLRAERGVISSQVLTRGRLLFAKDRGLLAFLIKRMWFDRADFWPYRDRILEARRKRAFGGNAS